MAKVIQVIVTEESQGNGTRENPYRSITQYWDFEGKLLADTDNFTPLEEQVVSLNLRLNRAVGEKEKLANTLEYVTAIRAGKRAIRISKAHELAVEVLESLKTPL